MVVPDDVFDWMAPKKNARTLTGYPSALLAYLFNKYEQVLPDVGGTPDWSGRDNNKYSKKLLHFFYLFVYIHMYPSYDQIRHVCRATGGKGISSTCFYDNVIPLAVKLALALDEIHYEDRLDPMNHHLFFPVGITTILDTFPVYVSAPSDSRLKLYQPK